MAYYCYILYDAGRENQVFYVGKGRGRRPQAHLQEPDTAAPAMASLDEEIDESEGDTDNVDAASPAEKEIYEVGLGPDAILDAEMRNNADDGAPAAEVPKKRKSEWIRELQAVGVAPNQMIRVIAQGLDESLAKTIEAFAIQFVYGLDSLSNRVQGYHFARFRPRGEWNSSFGTQAQSDAKPYYVYVLRDPSNGDVLYVGKGKGARMYAHFLEAEGLDDEERTFKHDALAELERRGHKPEDIARVIACDLDENEAFAVESFALKFVYGLAASRNTNKVRGHHSRHYRANGDWELRLGFDLPFLVASSKKAARQMERDLMLGEAMEGPLLAVINAFGDLQWGEPRIVDAGELAYLAPVQVGNGIHGGMLKVFIRSKNGVQIEFRPCVKAVKEWLVGYTNRFGYTIRRADFVFFPDAWEGKPTKSSSVAIKRTTLVLAFLKGLGCEDLIREVGEQGVVELTSVDVAMRARKDKTRKIWLLGKFTNAVARKDQCLAALEQAGGDLERAKAILVQMLGLNPNHLLIPIEGWAGQFSVGGNR